MVDQNERQLPPHWSRGWAHCAFTPQDPIIFGQGETILLAEKYPPLLKLGKSLLENLKYHPLTAGSAPEVVEQCRAGQIDALVVDVELILPSSASAMEEFLSEVRQFQPTLKILLSSAHDLPQKLSTSAPIQGLPVLTKPFTVRSFSQVISRCLANSS